MSFALVLLKVCISTAIIFYAAIWAGCTALRYFYVDLKKRQVRQVQKDGKYKGKDLPDGAYDVVIVGSGPAGSVAGYYSAKAGLKVAILERKSFPRDKFCGDAICVPAMRILKDMDLLKELETNDEIFYANSGGFVSPSGLNYFGASVHCVGEPLAGAVKRTHLDTRMAHRAQSVGADLKEEFDVETAQFDKKLGLWTIYNQDKTKSVVARVLFCSDGAQSKLATKLGYCTEPPHAISSRAFVEADSHNAKFDGIALYSPHSLPGYCAVFRHPKGELNFCYYLIPCGKPGMCGDVSADDLSNLHNYALKEDPFVSRAMGPNAKIEPMRVAPLRLACQGIKTTYDDHLLLLGDAAGFVDPITGEGIHNAMMSGRDAAETLIAMKKEGDFSNASCASYEDRWTNSFGYDFDMSVAASRLIYRFPILLDACAHLMQIKGDEMMSTWAKIMTGYLQKDVFFQPTLAASVVFAIGWFWFKTQVLGQLYSYGSTFKKRTTKTA